MRMRRELSRYAEIVEGQRRLLQYRRERALQAGELPLELEALCGPGPGPARDRAIVSYLAALDEMWAGHLSFVEEVKEGASLQRLGGEDPLLHFMRHVDEAFREGLQGVVERAAALREEPEASGPSGTWTYLVNDDPLPDFRVSIASAARAGVAAAAALAALPLAVLAAFAALVSGIGRLLGRHGRSPGA